MQVHTAPSFTSSLDAVSATRRIVVSYDWSSTRYFLPDHLNSTNVVTNASGTVIETLDYYPYGSTRIDQTTNNFRENKQFVAQYSDPETNLSYLQARYYDGSKGEFLSEDLMFLGDPKQQVLTDPQSLNSYSYANDNPTTKSDPSGKQCVECAGAEVVYSIGAQTTFDSFFGHSSPAVYGGDVVGGAIYGFGYPWTLAAAVPFAAASGGAGNATQQGLEYLSGDRNSFSASDMQSSAAISAGTQAALGVFPIPFISAGPLEKQIVTKLENGTISHVSNGTLGTIARTNGPGSLVGNFATNYAQTQYNNLASYSRSPSGSSAAASFASPSAGLVISLAQTVIKLAQAVIAAHK